MAAGEKELKEMKQLLMVANFVHENSEEVRVDIVRFSVPIHLKEIRVVPKGFPPHSTMKSSELFGKTSPDDFKLEVYSNDATNPLTPTFLPLGCIDLAERTLSLSVGSENPCDTVVLRGTYGGLSVCVYGVAFSPPSNRENVPIQSFGSQTARHSPNSFSDGHGEDGYRKRGQSPSDGEKVSKRNREDKGSDWSSLLDSYNTLFDPLSPDHSPEHSFDMYDDDIPTTKRSTTNNAGFEEFSDEEIAFGEEDDFDLQEQEQGIDFDFEDTWMTTNFEFNPYQTEISKLETFPNLFLTPHEAILGKKQKYDYGGKKSRFDERTRLRDLVNKIRVMKSLTLKWVESVEELAQQLYPGLAQLANRSPEDGAEMLSTLCQWVCLCVSESTLLTIAPPINIRALKTGLRLCLSLVSLGEAAVEVLLAEGVIVRLVDIVCQPAAEMPSSIKLQVLRSLSALLDYPVVMETFLNLDSKNDSSLYRRMLELVLTNPTSRVQSAISCLLQKAHIYETLTNLQKCVDQVIELTPVGENYWNMPQSNPSTNEDTDNMEQEEAPPPLTGGNESDVTVGVTDKRNEAMESEPSIKKEVPVLPPELIASITQLLRDLNQSFNKIDNLTLLPPKAFPGVCTPEQTAQDVFVGLARMCKRKRLLEGVLVLLTVPSMMDVPSVFGRVRSLLLTLISSHNGLMLLSSFPPVVNSIIRSLIQSAENEVPLDALQPLSSFIQEDSRVSCNAITLGMLLVHHLQVLQLIDSIRQAPKQTMNDLESECLPALHALFSMTLVPIGKYAVSYVLSLDSNLTYLLPFLEPRGQKEHDNKLSRSSISSRYAAVLVLQLLRSDIILYNDCLTSNIRRLLSIAEFFQDNPSSTMSALYSWLHPLKHIGDTTPTIIALMGVIRENVAHLSWNKPNKGSAAITTSLLMVLSRSCPSPRSSEYTTESLGRGHREAIIGVFSSSGMGVITSLLKKLSDIILPLWSQKQIIGVSNASVLVLLSTLSLKLLRLVLSELLGSGSFQLRDTGVLQALFALHTVMCSAPKSGVFQAAAPEIQSLIIDCLVTFTNPNMVDAKDPMGSEKNCWCLLLNELLTYTQATPHAFLSGLMLLSELLPLPLPVHSPKVHTSEEVATIVRYRHLWVGHLISLTSSLSSLLEMVIFSQSLSLQQILRRVSAQLIDLAPSLAMMLAQKTASKILAQIDSQDESTKDIDTSLMSAEKKETSSLLISLLTFCAVLSSQPMFKLALITLITSKAPGDEEEEEMDTEENYQRFIPLLLFLVQKKETPLPVKLCVMTILQSLVNVDISLRGPSKGERSLQELGDCLPLMSQLENITSTVVKHIGSLDQPLPTILVGLKILLLLLQSFPGRSLLLTLLPSTVKKYTVFMKRLISFIKESTPPTAESLQCLSLFLEILSSFIYQESDLSPSFPVPLIKYFIIDEDEEANDVDLLQELLTVVEESCQDHPEFLQIYTVPINDLKVEFEKHSASISMEGVAPPTLELPPMTSLELQFMSRISVLQTSLEDSTSPEYWLSTPPYDETQLEPERVITDLSSLATEVNPNLNLQEELKKQLLPSPPTSPAKERKKRKIVFSGPEAQKRLREAIQQRKAMGRGRDMFRARKQNTSRPPSMHVDDFMSINNRMPGNIQRGGVIPRGMPRDGMQRGRESFTMGRSYMLPPPMYPPHLGGRFMAGAMPSHYPRRDIPGMPMAAASQSWERRAQHFLASMHKPDPLAGRPMWPLMPPDPYSRARNARMVEIMSSYGPRPLPSSHISSRLSSSSRRT